MLFGDLRAAARRGRGSRRRRSAPTPSCPGGLRKVEPPVRARTGWVASRLARISAMRAAIGGRVAGRGAEARAHHDAARRQAGMAIGESRARRRAGAPARLRASRSRPSRGSAGDVAAIGAGIHGDRAADAAGNAGEEFQPGEPGRGRMFGDRRIERGGAGDDAVRLDRRSSPKPRASRITTPRMPPSRTIRLEAAPMTVTGMSSGRAAQELREVGDVGGPHQHFGRAADAEPGGRRRAAASRLHAAAQRRQDVDQMRRCARRPSCARPLRRRAGAPGLQRGQLRRQRLRPVA